MNTFVNPDASFWPGKSVLLTGHTGFKGAWLTKWLCMLGAHVTCVSHASLEGKSLYSLSKPNTAVAEQFVDIRDGAATREMIEAAQPDIVLHLAAQSLVRYSYSEPVETFATNIMGTAHILDSIRAVKSCKAVICVTSDKCYENREWLWPYRENDAMGGHDPYSGSKGAAELVIASMRRSYFSGSGTRVGSVRAGNVIGGGDWAEDRLIPDCVRAIEDGQSVQIRNPLATRPWQHVLEPLCGYLLLAEKLCGNDDGFDEGWNFGPRADDVQSVGSVVNKMQELWDSSENWVSSDETHSHEAMALNVDSTKATQRLNWVQRLSVDDAIAWTVDWYKRQQQGEVVDALCLEQIDQYMGLGNGN